jgi:hypothetical protein
LGLIAPLARSAAELAAYSREALDRTLRADAELCVAVASSEARVLGSFERAAEEVALRGLVRRGSGGPEVLVGPGTVHVALALTQPGSLVPCDEKRIVNRYVRPLLRALTATGSPAAFFGRDWISVSKRPAAWVGFGHDATTGRTLFEAFVGVTIAFARGERPSFREHAPGSLQSIAGRDLDPARIAEAIARAYAEGQEVERLDPPPVQANLSSDVVREPPWAATCDEAIGLLGAGKDARGVFRIGGDLLVSRDALARLEVQAAEVPVERIDSVVSEILTAPGVALDGIRSLASVRDVIVRARELAR